MSAFVPGCDHPCHHVFDKVKLREKSLRTPGHTGSGRIQLQIKGPGVGKPVLLAGISNRDAFPEESPCPCWSSAVISHFRDRVRA